MQMSSRRWSVIVALVTAAGCSKSEGAAPAPSPKAVAAPTAPADVQTPAPVAPDRLILPQRSVGEITRTTDRRSLDKLFPRGVVHTTCSFAEEEDPSCSHLALGGKPGLIVVWDHEMKAEEVHVYTDAFATAGGVKVGITLADLVAANGGKPVTLLNAYIVPADGELVDGWRLEDFGEGPLRDQGLMMTLQLDAATTHVLRDLATVSSSDARLARSDIRVASIQVPLDSTPREVSVEGEDYDEAEADDAPADDGDPTNDGPSVVATLPVEPGDVRSVPWATLSFRCTGACTPRLATVVYGDLESDGAEEAVVVTTTGLGASNEDQTANLYGVRDGKVVWLGRVQDSGFAHPEYAPTFVAAKLGGGALEITWRYHLWGDFDHPGEDLETRVETFALRADRAVRIAATEH